VVRGCRDAAVDVRRAARSCFHVLEAAAPPAAARLLAALGQGLTLVHFSAQRKHTLWGTFGAWLLSPSLSDRWTRGGVTKTA